MLEANTQSLIQYPGIAMGKFGKIDDAFGGGNLFRLIWAPSRKVILMLDRGATTVQQYVHVEPLPNPNVWLLEKWMPADKLTALTKEEWNRDPDSLMSGPYPAKGDYVMAGLPLTCHPSQANIEKLIQWIEAGKHKTRAQNAIAIQNGLDRQAKERNTRRKDMIDNQLLPYGGEAWSGRTKGRGTKTISPKFSAQDLGLPTKSGFTGASPVHKPVTYQVPLES